MSQEQPHLKLVTPEFEAKLAALGYTPADIEKLLNNDLLQQLLPISRVKGEVRLAWCIKGSNEDRYIRNPVLHRALYDY